MKFLWFFAAVPLLGHSLYFVPAKFRVPAGETVVFSVHNGDSFPAGDEPPDPGRLLDGRLVSGGASVPFGDLQILGRGTHGAVRLSEPGSQWLAVRTAPNFLELDGASFESYLKEEGLDHAVESRAARGESAKPGRERYTKYAKSLLICETPSETWTSILGLNIEFVPEADPARLRPGDALPVRVLWNGKPAAGLQVERAWAAGGKSGVNVAGRTGPDGRILVPLDKAGTWRLHTVAIERAADSQADWESFWASLTFEIQ